MSQLEKLSGNEVYTGWIYVIKNTINNKIYIGQTSKNLYIRFKQHKRDCEKNFHNMLIHKAMNKYGTENFLIRPVDIIKCVTLTDFKKELNKLEMYYINIFKTTNKDIGYNLTNGGGGCTGRILSETTKKKISDSKIGEKNPMYGKKWSSAKRIQMKNLMTAENNHNYGKPLSEKTKQKLSNALKNREISIETRKKISESMIGIKKTDEMRKKLSESKKGTTLSEQTKQKIKNTRLTGSDNPKSKRVGQYDFDNNLINVFFSMSDAARECKTFHSSISACCNGKKQTSGGFKWKYILE